MNPCCEQRKFIMIASLECLAKVGTDMKCTGMSYLLALCLLLLVSQEMSCGSSQMFEVVNQIFTCVGIYFISQ